MTVKEELKRLKLQKEGLDKERSQMQKRLEEELRPQEGALLAKGRELSKRTSTLAKKLQEDNRQKFEDAKRITNTAREALEEVMAQLQETQRQINEREYDTTLYIQEQVERMIPEFLKWVKENAEEIGSDIKRTFYIVGLKELRETFAGECPVFTGNVGILDENASAYEYNCIVSSKDFYFEEPCYVIGSVGEPTIIEQTEWYHQYLSKFIEALLKKLSEVYDYGENLKLTIESPNFTLELV